VEEESNRKQCKADLADPLAVSFKRAHPALQFSEIASARKIPHALALFEARKPAANTCEQGKVRHNDLREVANERWG
jgi:hypothetical protein